MNAIEFKEKAENLISQMEDLLSEMPSKGLKSDECQKLCLQQALNEFSYAVNGVRDIDFVNEEE